MTTHRVPLLLTLALASVSASPTAGRQARDEKPVPIGTSTLSGAVMTDDGMTVPARRATVTVTGDVIGRRGIVAVTDDNGRFVFMNLPGDRYSLKVSKAGYLTAEYRSRHPGGPGVPVSVADGASVTGLTLKLMRGCVLTGSVFDESGRPVSGVSVSALKYAMSSFSGERVVQQVQHPEAITDDRGSYRIYGLRPGEYLVAAALPGFDSQRNPADIRQITDADIQRAQQLLRGPVGTSAPGAPSSNAPLGPSVEYAGGYHPAALTPTDAARITLGPREERAGVDVVVRIVPTTKVEGVASTPDGKPIANATLYFMNPAPPPSGYFAMTMRSARTDRDGRFVFGAIPAGRYTISTENVDQGIVTEVTIEGREMSLPLTLSPPVVMTGKTVFDGAVPRPADPKNLLPTFRAARESAAMRGRLLQMNSDGTFTYGFVPGTYRVTGLGSGQWQSQPPTGWTLKSLIVNGVDVSDIRFDVKPGDKLDAVATFTDQRSEISGLLLTASGAPAPDYVLIVYSADRRHWIPFSRRTRELSPAADGRFVVPNLPPGDYLISAVADLEPGDSNDEAFLADLAAHQPVRISLGAGEKKLQDIRAGG